MLKLRQCEICGKDLELLCRMDQIYCSKECRQRAYRIRKKERAMVPAQAASAVGVQEPTAPHAASAANSMPRRDRIDVAPVRSAPQPPPRFAAQRPSPPAAAPPAPVSPPPRLAAPAKPAHAPVPAPPIAKVSREVPQAPELGARTPSHPPQAQAPRQAPAPAPEEPPRWIKAQQWHEILHPRSEEPGAARTLASETARFEPLRRAMLQVPEAVSYKLGEAVKGQLVPIWHPETGKPIRRLDGSLSDRPYRLRPDFEPPIVPKSGLYAIELLDAAGEDLKLPRNLIFGLILDATG